MLGNSALGQLALAQFPYVIVQEPTPPPPVPTPTLIVNGWYVDSKGGIYYYYRYSNGEPGPTPPVSV